MTENWREEELRKEMTPQMENLTLELPKFGPVSYDSIERCAREAGVPIHEWVQDALCAYVRMHEREVRERQAAYFGVNEANEPKRRRVPAWRMRVGEWAYIIADKLTDDGSYHED